MKKVSHEIKLRLMTTISKTFNLDLNDINDKLLEQSLLGDNFRLSARDLLHLFFTIEKEFEITIPQEAIVDGKFNTFNNIAQIIECQLEKTEKDAV